MAANSLSFDFIRDRLSREQLEDLAVSLGLCLECGGSLVVRDGEVVCSRCGLVWSVENVAESLPFPEDGEDDGAVKCFEGHWQPGNTLAFLQTRSFLCIPLMIIKRELDMLIWHCDRLVILLTILSRCRENAKWLVVGVVLWACSQC